MNLVTVCRLDKNKNVIACLEVAQKLKSLSVVFRWIIVGDGTEREYITTQIADRKLEDVIVLAGYQRNPYPYIMNSDVMISTSLSESYGMAVVLHVPAIAFSYPALTEVIDQGKNGFIIDQGILTVWLK